MEWARILAYITGTVDQELLLRNEYLATENRILRAQIKGRLLLSDAEKKRLVDIGHRLGRKALEDVANTAKPDTILGWYRKFVARKFDGSKARRHPGRPRVDREIEDLVVQMAKDNIGTLPGYVRREFDDFLRCGWLEGGFLRVQCERCHDEKQVAFSWPLLRIRAPAALVNPFTS